MTKAFLLLVVISASCKHPRNHPTPMETIMIDTEIDEHNGKAKARQIRTENPFDADTTVTFEKWLDWCDANQFNYIEKLDTLRIGRK